MYDIKFESDRIIQLNIYDQYTAICIDYRCIHTILMKSPLNYTKKLNVTVLQEFLSLIHLLKI